MTSNNSFKPNLLRYTNNMAGKACHVVGSATQVGLTQALGMQERPLYVVRYEAQPLPGSDDFGTCSGAAVNVWVEATTEQQALAVASQEVHNAGWLIESLEAVFPITRDDYSEDPTGLEYFEQALVDGVVLVFHTWQEGTRH